MKRIEESKYYYITENGVVYTNSKGKGLRELKQKLDTSKYYRVCLVMENCENKNFLVHRLVAKAYIDNPEGLEYVNHKDGDKLNNHFSNLEWVTSGDNQRHAYSTGLKNIPRGESNGRNRLSEEDVLSIYWRLYEGARNIDIRREYDIGSGTLTCIKNKTNWKYLLQDLPDIPIRQRSNKLSEDTVRWICRKFVEGYSSVEVYSMSNNLSVTIHQIEDIKRRKCHSSISCEYDW